MLREAAKSVKPMSEKQVHRFPPITQIQETNLELSTLYLVET